MSGLSTKTSTSSGKTTSDLSAKSWDSLVRGSSHRKQVWSDTALGGFSFSSGLQTNVRLSDDEKSRSMSHHSDSQIHQQEGDEEFENETAHPASEIADIVVGNPVIMQNLIQSLSHCTSNKLAFMFAHTDCLSSLQKTADQTEAVTVGDLIFTILRNLKEKCSDRNVMVDNLFRFFTAHPPVMSQLALTRLSEPLLFFTLRMLSSYSAIKKFIDLGKQFVVFFPQET